jgi:hypothetical protein
MFHIGTEQFAFGRPTIPNRADWVALAGMSQLAGTVHDVPGPLGPRASLFAWVHVWEGQYFGLSCPSVDWFGGVTQVRPQR